MNIRYVIPRYQIRGLKKSLTKISNFQEINPFLVFCSTKNHKIIWKIVCLYSKISWFRKKVDEIYSKILCLYPFVLQVEITRNWHPGGVLEEIFKFLLKSTVHFVIKKIRRKKTDFPQLFLRLIHLTLLLNPPKTIHIPSNLTIIPKMHQNIIIPFYSCIFLVIKPTQLHVSS